MMGSYVYSYTVATLHIDAMVIKNFGEMWLAYCNYLYNYSYSYIKMA